MTKKITLLFFILIVSITANSQVLISLILGDKLNSENLEFGLDGGFNWASNSGFESNTPLRALNLGFYFDIRIKNQWSLYTGVLVKSEVGNGNLTDDDLTFLDAESYPYDGEYSQVINSFIIPAFIQYKFVNHIYVEGGPQLGLKYNAWIEFEHDSDTRYANMKYYNKDQFTLFDAGFSVGTGYKLLQGEGMTIGVKYYQGVVNVVKGIDNSKNRAFYLKVCIPIGKANVES